MPDIAAVTCPYCGEPIDLVVDVSAGGQAYVEDCAVCCQPIEVSILMAADGSFEVVVRTGDE